MTVHEVKESFPEIEIPELRSKGLCKNSLSNKGKIAGQADGIAQCHVQGHKEIWMEGDSEKKPAGLAHRVRGRLTVPGRTREI